MNLHLSRFAVCALAIDAHTGAILDPAQRVATTQARCVQKAHSSNCLCKSIMRWEVQHDQL